MASIPITKEARDQFKNEMWLMAARTELSRQFEMDSQVQSWRGIELQDAGASIPSSQELRDIRTIKAEGNALYAKQRYTDAIEKYKAAMRVFLGEDFVLPTQDYLNEKYLLFGDVSRDQRDIIEVAACAGNIAQSYAKMYEANKRVEDLIALIDWTEEIRILYDCLKYSVFPDAPAWRQFHLKAVEFFTVPIKRFSGLANIYRTLGNTSLGSTFSHLACNYFAVSDGATNRSKILALRSIASTDYGHFINTRHPEPSIYAQLEVTHPELQICGAWEKLEVAPGRKPHGRSCLSSWIWDGKLYVGGGMNDVYMEERDMWCMTLSTRKWKRLPDLPPIRPSAGLYTSRPMRNWQGKTYLFTGDTKVWVFNCATEKWGSVNTKFRGTWPYPNNDLVGYSSAVLEGKLYIFGGDDLETRLGVDIFMELDLETLRWRHINGSAGVKPHRSTPGLRVFTQLWAVPEQRKLYLCYGDANRSQAERAGHPSGFHTDHTYTDLWSYSLETQSWKRERFRGNFPSPRAEHCVVYNPVLKRAIMFGGYNAEMNSGIRFTFSFFSDTFIQNPETGIWQHVLTKGFPTYRAQCAFVADPDTGITYLHGGWTNSDYFPSKAVLNRTFDDLWQLKLDMDGGFMTEDDYHIDPRTVPHGPWFQCFGCRRFEQSPKKCMGTCGGIVFFCSKSCQESGWAEHKQKHGCGKR
ncbi:hypothetical protein BXZ70DRAFT_926571 [Cristinia sonorae]|uniref:Uncharacterized protein n=1 Tax=Cristinia sonorae TaxID=1940300 RepID=A0A8K0UVK5_9AGAR|nr:hypothetical protein BXZ70DRAFT_926571 [Cristinia sonorae]